MNRNNRLYLLDTDGEKKFTAAGLLLQFWILSEGAGQVLSEHEQRLARRVVDNVMDAWQVITEAPLSHRSLPEGVRGSEMSNTQLLQLVDTIEEACTALGADKVFEIIYRPNQMTVH
jgi:hypothetical protein